MEPGRLAPCIAHDVDGGVGKSELGWILSELVADKMLRWDFIQSRLMDLRNVLIGQDKSNLSTRLPGKIIHDKKHPMITLVHVL
jgi:hypothetical protein